MAQYQVKGPDGSDYQFEAASDEDAAAAVDELFSSAGGAQGQPQPPGGMDVQGRFTDAFDPNDPDNLNAFRPQMEAARPAMMEAADRRMNGEADDRGRAATLGNALTMGFGDEFMGALAGGLTWAQGKGFDEGYGRMTSSIRGDIDRFAERRPLESTALEIAGALPTAMIPGGAAVRGASLGAKVARGGLAGAGYGAVQGYGEGEGGVANRVNSAAGSAAVGAGIGAAVPIIGAGIGKVAGKRAGKAAVPSVEQLDDAATALYQRADNAGIAVQPKAVQRLTSILPQRLANMGFDPVLHPKSARVMQILDERVTQAMQPSQSGAHTVLSLGEVENMRRVIRQAITASSGPNDKADREMAQRILDQFDTWMTGLQPRDMLAAGPNGLSGREAIQIVQEARGLWSRKSKGDMLADLVERAKLDDDFERGIRREFRTLSRSKEKMRPFTAGEKEAIRNVAKGGPMGWLMRAIGSFSPTSLAGAARSGVVGGLGVATGNPAAAALPAVGYIGKKAADAMTRGALGKAGAVVRAGGAVPIDTKAAKTAGDYATRLIGAAGQASAPRPGIEIMFPNDSPAYR